MHKVVFFALLVVLLACETPPAQQPEQPLASADAPTDAEARLYFLLKAYDFDSAQQQATTDLYLQEHWVPAATRLAAGPIGAFHRKTSDTDTVLQTYLLVPINSLEQLVPLDELDRTTGFSESPYARAAHDAPPYARQHSTVLRAFSDFPGITAPTFATDRSERVYELRSYESATEALYRRKLKMFNAGGEVKLFDRLGFNAVFYGEVLAGNAMPNLMYMTTFPSRPVRDSLWKEFGDAPEWKALTAQEQYDNTVSRADIYFLEPTQYSAY